MPGSPARRPASPISARGQLAQVSRRLGFSGAYPHPELNGDQRFRKPFLALCDCARHMHDNRMTTILNRVFSLPVNLSPKRTVSHSWCCNLLHGKRYGSANRWHCALVQYRRLCCVALGNLLPTATRPRKTPHDHTEGVRVADTLPGRARGAPARCQGQGTALPCGVSATGDSPRLCASTLSRLFTPSSANASFAFG